MKRSIRGGLILMAIAIADAAAACPTEPSAAVRLEKPSARATNVPFGNRVHPVLGMTRMHAGIDFDAPIGDPVTAAAGGTVIKAARDGEYGNRVEIDHGGGVVTSYSHLARFAPGVELGACIEAGAAVGTVGTTGLSAGPHLHFEVIRDGTPVDPAPLLPP